ncbi:MAG: Na/Pi cotransporter family protein [Lachnospiraceae bacterium]|nr:Na/Pi cotransporter family protein [Lachnospiraceae bacterium]
MNATIILELAGGLGLFLFGMSLMSEGIEKAAGAKLRGILGMFTKNRFMGTLVGILFTGIIQSSSACTVMVVSFVNSGLMSLTQAAGIIFGANIGTTITSQLVSFNLSKIAPVFVLGGVLVVMFCKNETIKKIGDIVLGFGVLFMGLSGMSQSMSGLKESPQIVNALTGMNHPLLALLLGVVATSIIQSSSVTVSIILLMANQGLLDLSICLYVIIGCNIGACSSAMIASLSGKKNAKRAALIHLLFNVIGTIIFFIILQFAADPIVNMISRISSDNGRFVANAHTIIKVIQVIILFPFSNLLVKLTYLIVPGEDVKVNYRDSYTLKYIGDKVVFNPATAVVEVINELERMADLAGENLNRAMNALITLDQDDIDEVFEVEKNIDFLNRAITNYMVKINQSTLPIEDLKSIGALFHVANDIERVGDHAENIVECAIMRKEKNISISKEAQIELGKMLDMVNDCYRFSVEMFAHGKDEHMQKIIELEDKIDLMERELQKSHVRRLTNNQCTPEAGMIFSDIVSGLERIGDHAVNIAFSISENEKESTREKVNEN